ncbi:hypothetical protein FOZ62_000638, partial [Perkinsus olseni]
TVINDFTIDILDQNLIDAPGEDDPKPTAQSTTAGSRGPQQGGASGEGAPMKSPSGSDAGQPSDSDANGGAKSQQQRKKVWSDIQLRRKLAKFVHASSMALGKLKQGFEEQHPQCSGCGTAAQIKRIAKYERRGTNSCMAWWVTQEAIKELKLQPKTMENLAEKRSWSLHRSVPLQPRKRRQPGPPPPPTSRETANSGSGEGGGESGEGGGSSSDGGGDAKRMRRITDYFPAKSATPGPKDTPLAASTPVPDPAPPPVDDPQEAAQPPAVEADVPPRMPALLEAAAGPNVHTTAIILIVHISNGLISAMNLAVLIGQELTNHVRFLCPYSTDEEICAALGACNGDPNEAAMKLAANQATKKFPAFGQTFMRAPRASEEPCSADGLRLVHVVCGNCTYVFTTAVSGRVVPQITTRFVYDHELLVIAADRQATGCLDCPYCESPQRFVVPGIR